MKVLRYSAVLMLAVGMFSATAIAQDDCLTAVPVPGGLDPCLDTNPTGPLPGACAASSTSLNDMWLTFVAPATSARVRTDLTPTTGTDSDYMVYQGTCTSLVAIGCSEDEGVGFLGNICIGGLVVGNTYYVQLGAWASETTTYAAYGPQYNPYLGSCGDYNVDIQAAGTCGNSVLECGEQCDPPGPCCSATCQKVSICGNGCLEAPEQCDDGNTTPGDGCTNCQLPICGDSVTDVGEECDPPGTVGGVCGAGNACNSICKCLDTGIPAVSEWGLVVLTLIGLVSGTILFGRRRAAA